MVRIIAYLDITSAVYQQQIKQTKPGPNVKLVFTESLVLRLNFLYLEYFLSYIFVFVFKVHVLCIWDILDTV